jgi:death-on-curing protein
VSERVWIDVDLALAIHERLLSRHGGLAGVRDGGLLASALARPRQIEAYEEAADSAALSAAHTSGIIRNHPFADGNKRVGFVVGVLFLELNGAVFTASESAATAAVYALAAGTVAEAQYADFLRAQIVGA